MQHVISGFVLPQLTRRSQHTPRNRAHRQLMAPADPFNTFPSTSPRPAAPPPHPGEPRGLWAPAASGPSDPPTRSAPMQATGSTPAGDPATELHTDRRGPRRRRAGLAGVGIAAIAMVAGAGGGYLAGGGTTTRVVTQSASASSAAFAGQSLSVAGVLDRL